jgi:hypothetical protein
MTDLRKRAKAAAALRRDDDQAARRRHQQEDRRLIAKWVRDVLGIRMSEVTWIRRSPEGGEHYAFEIDSIRFGAHREAGRLKWEQQRMHVYVDDADLDEDDDLSTVIESLADLGDVLAAQKEGRDAHAHR